VRKRTLANLSALNAQVIEALKVLSRLVNDRLPLRSFNSLLKDLATLDYNITYTRLNSAVKIVLMTRPTTL